MSAVHLHSVEELDQTIGKSGKQLLFKHSTTCPISAAAYGEFRNYLAEQDTPASVIFVIEDRPVSNAAAERLGMKHESPQIFLLEDGQVKWHASHWKITAESIKEAMGQ